MEIKLKLPLKDVLITQRFGSNYLGFYKKMGLDGHNGLDWKAKTGCKLYACHGGLITYAGTDKDGGKSVTICNTVEGTGFKTIYYHLSKITVQKGQPIKSGDIIGNTGNTGKYTTGQHLHLGLKKIFDGQTIDYANGYKGAIDPSSYFKKNWDKSNSYHRYGRKGSYIAEIQVRFKNPWLHRYLIRRNMLNKIYDNEFINALVYGGWDIESVINEALYESWGWAKKDEILRGKINFK